MRASLGLLGAVAGGRVGKPTLCLQAPTSLITLRSWGLLFCMYLFFLWREKEYQARQSAVTGRRDLLPALCFGFPVLPRPAPESSLGRWSCPKLVGLERTSEATLLALGQA